MKQSSIINHQSSMFCSANGAVSTPPCNSHNFSQSIRDLNGSRTVVDTTVTTQSKVSLFNNHQSSIFNHQSAITRALLFLAFILLPMVGWGADSDTHVIEATATDTVYSFNLFTGSYTVSSPSGSAVKANGVMTFSDDNAFNKVNPKFIITCGKFVNGNNNAKNYVSQVGNSSSDKLGNYKYIAGLSSDDAGYRGILCCTKFKNLKKVVVNSLSSGNSNDQHWLMIAIDDPTKDVSELTFTKVANCTGKSVSLSKTYSTPVTAYVAVVAFRSGSSVQWKSTQGVYGFTATMASNQSGPVDPTITFNNSDYEIGSELDLSTLFTSNSQGTVTYSVKDAGTTGASVSGTTFTATTAGTATVTASQAEEAGKYNAKAVDATITVKAAAKKWDITYAETKGADMSAYPTQYTEGVGVASFAALADITGFHFTGWTPASISASATGAQTITAQWQTLYTLTFAAGEGTGSMTALQYAENAEVTLPACTFTAPAGKAFDKWTSTDVTITNGKFNMPAKAVTVTATYKNAPIILVGTTPSSSKSPLTDVVYFNKSYTSGDFGLSGGMGGDVSSKTDGRYVGFTVPDDYTAKVTIAGKGSSGRKLSLVTEANRASSTWDNAIITATMTGTSNVVSASTSTNINPGVYRVGSQSSGLTVTSVVVELTASTSTYTVTYDANNATSGSVPTDNTEYDKNATVTVKGNTGNLARTGYNFAGWNTKADGTGTTYSAVSPFGTFSITANTTLYAKWEGQSYDLTATLTNVSANEAFPAKIAVGSPVERTISAAAGYALPDDFTVTNATKTWNKSTGALTLSNPTDAVSFTIAGVVATPSITAHPQGASYTKGASANNLSVTASANGGTLSYQWQSSSDQSNWTNVGTNQSTFQPSTAAEGTSHYRCVVTNTTGDGASATSNKATIVVSKANESVTWSNPTLYQGGKHTITATGQHKAPTITAGTSTTIVGTPTTDGNQTTVVITIAGDATAPTLNAHIDGDASYNEFNENKSLTLSSCPGDETDTRVIYVIDKSPSEIESTGGKTYGCLNFGYVTYTTDTLFKFTGSDKSNNYIKIYISDLKVGDKFNFYGLPSSNSLYINFGSKPTTFDTPTNLNTLTSGGVTYAYEYTVTEDVYNAWSSSNYMWLNGAQNVSFKDMKQIGIREADYTVIRHVAASLPLKATYAKGQGDSYGLSDCSFTYMTVSPTAMTFNNTYDQGSYVTFQCDKELQEGDSLIFTGANFSQFKLGYGSSSFTAFSQSKSLTKKGYKFTSTDIAAIKSSNATHLRIGMATSTATKYFCNDIILVRPVAPGSSETDLHWTIDPGETVEKTFSLTTPSENTFTYTAATTSASAGAITYESNNTDVAIVDVNTGAVTIKNETGEATITATIAASGCFTEKSISYKVSVTKSLPSDKYGISRYWGSGDDQKALYEYFTAETETRYVIENYTMPATDNKFWIGGENGWDATFSAEAFFKDAFKLSGTDNWYVGEGVTTTLVVDPTQKATGNNLNIKAEYTFQVAYNNGSSNWLNLPFAQVEGTKYETEVVTLNGGYYANEWGMYVGTKKSDGSTLFYNNKSADQLLKNITGLGETGDLTGKFRIFIDSSDPNWYCSFVSKLSYKLLNDDDSEFQAAQEIWSDAASKTTTFPAEVPSKDGYTCIGWARTKGATEVAVAPSGNYDYWKTNDVFYPVWQAKSYDITYTNTFDVAHDNPATYTIESETITFSAPTGTRTGYNFSAWSPASIEKGSTGNKEISASWTAQQYTISYKDKDDVAYSGSNESALPATHTYGTATALVNGVRAGYEFNGWFTTSACDGSAITSVAADAYTDNFTLYAKWGKVKTTPTITWADFADAKLGELVTFTITTTSDADLTNAITVTGGTLRSAAVSGKSITAQVACPTTAGTVTVQFVTDATEDYTATDMSKNITVKACSMTESVIPVKSECTNRGSSVTPRYVWNTENVGLLTRAFGSSSTSSTSITSYGGSSYRTSSNSTQWMFQSSMDDVTKVRFYLYCNNDAVSFSNYYQSEEYFSSVSDKIKQSVTATLSNGSSTFGKDTYGYIDIPLAKEMNTGDFGMFVVSNNVYAISVGLFTEKPTEPTLTWSDKQTSAIEITYDPTAATHTINLSAVANSIGDITYGIKTNTDGLISSYADGVITLNAVAGSAEVQVTVAEAGCYSEKTITRTITQSLPTISKPTVSIATDGSQTVCSVDVEDLGTITATPACETADAEFTYQWFKGGELISDATANTYKPSAAGIYTCKVTAAKTGYTSAISDASNELTYTVNDTPSPTISGENGVALNTDLPLTATAYDGATYQWYSCDDDQKSNPVLIDGATTNVYTVNKSLIGTYYYYCLVTSANNCPAETSVKTITVSSMTAITLSQPDATTKGTEAVNAYYNAAMPEITIPQRTGYNFLGYFDAETEGKQYYTSEGASAANWDKEDATATLHAQWSINSYNLTWTLNGGEITTPGTAAGLVEYNAVVTAPEVARTGYQFGGWEPEVVSPMPASDKEYTAQWTASQYAITYKDQGNKDFSGVHGASYPQTHTYGTATTLVNPTKAAYAFDGWYTSADCTTGKVTTLGATDYTAAITLYAKWNTKEVYDDYIFKKQSSAGSCVENPDVTANANQAQTDLNYSSAAITGATKMDRPSSAGDVFTLTYTPATGYAITSICTYGKLEENKGAQISWDGGETWTDVAKYTLEQQKEFSSPDVEGSLSFIIKYTLETAGSGGLYWRNARVNMKTHVPMTDPVLSLSENEAEIAIPSYLQSGSTTVMLSGKNLGKYNGEYSVTAPQVDGLTISPTTFTVAEGKVAQEFTITFSTTQDEVEENDVDFVFAIPNSGLSQTLNLTYSKAHGVQQTNVTASTTWDWSNAASAQIKLTDAKNVELVLANVPGVTNNATFNSQALKFSGEYVYNKPKDKDAYASVGHIKFNTTVQGRVSVTFASNNSSNSRCVAINGEKSATTKGTFITFTALVDKGEVVIMGYEGSTENAYLQIQEIVFEAANHYRENLTIGNIGSVCWPYEVAPEDRYGAEFFEISCQTQEYDEAKGKLMPYKVYFDLVEGNLEAGKPYIFIPTETKIMLFNSNDEAATAPANYNGFFGTFSDITDDAKGTAGNVLEGNYMVYNNTFKLCGGKCNLNSYRAYLNLVKDGAAKVPVKGAAEVQNSPKRRVVLTGNGFEYLEPNPNPLVTEIGEVEGETNLDEPQKLLIDNQVIIIRNGQMYNAQGALLR